MDPLSIASGAAGLAISCATIVKTLYTWIDDTVDVDENVSNLLEEVSILSRVLDSVSNASGRVPQAIVAEIDPGNAFWSSISATLDDIQNTFDKLKQLMAELEKTNRFSRGFLRKPTKQIKFSLRSKDITIYKDRIKSYNTAMTSAFQMLNINSSQDSVFKVLSGLKSQLRNVEDALHTNSSAGPVPSSGREEDDRATQNLRQFFQVAENFHSSASTILREGPRSTVWGGSIMGDPLTEAQTSLIERWIPPPVNEEPHSPLDADSDSETEFARRFEELAIKNEADGDHAKAEQFYRGAIEHARNRIAEAEVHRSFIPNYETIAIDPEALTYLDRSVGALTRPCNISDMVQQTQQPLAFQQEYPPSQPYTTAASGPVPSAGKFQYPKTFGSQYTSPPTPNSHQGVVQYPTQYRQTRSNEESSSNPTIPRKAIGHPDPILSTMHRPQNIGQYSQQQQPEQPRRSTNLSYSHNNDLSGFGLLYDFDSHWYDHIRVGLRAMGWTDDLIKANQQTFIDYFKFRPIPTVIYYDQYNKVVGWGHDTADALGPTGDPKPGVQKVEGLPLLLIQETEKHIPLPGIPPGLNAQRLGSMFLDNEQTIHWIITSSEIWANRNKTLWKRALQRAGYLRDENDTRLSFIGEAEASINHAILRYSLSQETKGYFIFASFGKKEAHVFVCTLPLAPFHFVYRLVSNENQGPSLIAQRFAEVVRTKIKGMRLPDGSRIARKVYAKCIDDFENRILSDFRNNGQEWDVDVAIETEFPDLRIKDGFMTYTNGEILSCFQPLLDRITTIMAHAVGGVLKAGNVLEGIVLAGEFCTSEYLLREIKSKLPDNLRNKVYPPMEPATQVVLGAAHLELTRYLSSGRGYVKHKR
ncbi:hypothetical protein FPRO04_12194 [Fusarium proliferatum]|nr:hypothetical protein FPRO04_12194 [Fusarium proliferatum]